MASSWQLNKTLAESNEYMLSNEIFSDITFLAGSDQTPVKAHKYMLISRSPVFCAMFCGQLAESRDSIELPDVEADILKTLLRYLYTSKCPIQGDNVMHLLYCAKKYNIQALEQECKSFLENSISAESVCIILQQAHEFDDKDLVDKCKQLISVWASDVLRSEGFQALPRDMVNEVTSKDELLVTNEFEVYVACKRWAKAQCERNGKDSTPSNLREVLGDIVYNIGFPLMELEQFTRDVSIDGILTDSELVGIYQYITGKKDLKHFRLLGRRLSNTSNFLSIERFTSHGYSWAQGGLEDAVSVSLSENAFLVGLSLFLPQSGGGVSGDVKVLNNNTILVSKCVTLCYSGEAYVDVMFDRSLYLEKDKTYTLSQAFIGGTTDSGQCGLSTVKAGGVVVTFTESDRSENGTGITKGQFARILIVPIPNKHDSDECAL